MLAFENKEARTNNGIRSSHTLRKIPNKLAQQFHNGHFTIIHWFKHHYHMHLYQFFLIGWWTFITIWCAMSFLVFLLLYMIFLLIKPKCKTFIWYVTKIKPLHILLLDYLNLHRKFLTQNVFLWSSSMHGRIKMVIKIRRLYPYYFLYFYLCWNMLLLWTKIWFFRGEPLLLMIT